ncbi:MAG: isoprenyl transferase [Alphaproteobacteria bacterium]|nr:isoprenyl transferase [Alphaproteobacteria bacterium]
MDGNGRWAKKRNLPRSAGHKKGAETLQEIVKGASEMGIKYMTVYAFSTENWKRDKSEVDYLMDLLRHYLKSEFDEINKQGGRILFIGERNMLDDDIVAQMENIENKTSGNDKFTFIVALSYGSRAEILSAVKKVSSSVAKGDILVEDIDENLFSSMLYTRNIPDPDLVIRTSGEQRISNYLLWQLAYSELFFTKTLWPDFTVAELKEIINDFNSRERRYGKV